MRGRRRVGAGSCSAWLIIVLLLGPSGCVPATIHPAGDTPLSAGSEAPRRATMPYFTGHFFVTTDGERLPLRRWLPRGKMRAVILALHGFNDYDNAFASPGAAWADDGIATYAYDQRGFGAAPGRGRWPGSRALAIDAAAACGVLHRLYPDIPIYLLGESMGGAVAIVTMTGESGASIPNVDGLILVAPAVWGRSTMGVLPRLALAVAARLAPGLTLTGRGLHILASDNIPMLRALAHDPLVIKDTRVDTIYGLVNLMDAALAAAPRLHVPLLLLYGAHDEVIPKLPIRRFVRSLPRDPADPRSLAYYPKGYHMLLRDLDGRTPTADIAEWVDDARAPLPSGADRAASSAVWGGKNAERRGNS
ncbi:MAG: alpha/beta fold hydrolase [Stellaceae bacterium]